jgi:hypothetical protein
MRCHDVMLTRPLGDDTCKRSTIDRVLPWVALASIVVGIALIVAALSGAGALSGPVSAATVVHVRHAAADLLPLGLLLLWPVVGLLMPRRREVSA